MNDKEVLAFVIWINRYYEIGIGSGLYYPKLETGGHPKTLEQLLENFKEEKKIKPEQVKPEPTKQGKDVEIHERKRIMKPIQTDINSKEFKTAKRNINYLTEYEHVSSGTILFRSSKLTNMKLYKVVKRRSADLPNIVLLETKDFNKALETFNSRIKQVTR